MTTTVPPSTTGKRARTPSHNSPLSVSFSSGSSPETKILRSSTSLDGSAGSGQGRQRPILCTLPPTCNHHPTTLADSKELERHYATYHAHVCEQPGCGCVFPEARLLELHQTECHDPLAVVRKERGEKIFGCLLQTCPRLFLTPKARRLHMVEVHKYPKEFFFAVTNKGIGGLLQKWGEGASMIRGEWKPRDKERPGKTGEKGQAKEGDAQMKMAIEDEEEEEEESSSEEELDMDMEEVEKTPRPPVRPLHPGSPPRAALTSQHVANTRSDADVDALAEGMTSLSLVPPSIRFGRGGRGGALGGRGRGRGGRGGIIPPHVSVGGGHHRSASAVASTEGDGMRGGGSRGRRGRGHRAGGSVGSSTEVELGGSGGDVVLVGRGRGRRGRKDNVLQ